MILCWFPPGYCPVVQWPVACARAVPSNCENFRLVCLRLVRLDAFIARTLIADAHSRLKLLWYEVWALRYGNATEYECDGVIRFPFLVWCAGEIRNSNAVANQWENVTNNTTHGHEWHGQVMSRSTRWHFATDKRTKVSSCVRLASHLSKYSTITCECSFAAKL